MTRRPAVEIRWEGSSRPVSFLGSGPRGVAVAREWLSALNRGTDFGPAAAAEWLRGLGWMASGRAARLSNPYSDLGRYRVAPLLRGGAHAADSPLVLPFPAEGGAADGDVLKRTLLVLAVGGADTTFYAGLTPEAVSRFLDRFLPPELSACLDPSERRTGVPRAFAAKPAADGVPVTVVESLVLRAYAEGIRHAVLLTNAAAAPAIRRYLAPRFKGRPGLKWTVAVQPLFPALEERNGVWTLDPENGGYPAGHGHGFKHALLDRDVRRWVREDGLAYFLFGNGDNAALFRAGAAHFAGTLANLARLRRGAAPAAAVALYLVWDRLQKGGFAFRLEDRRGPAFPQIVEVELAAESGADIGRLEREQGGYNTNVAVGLLRPVRARLGALPLVMKQKTLAGRRVRMVEASFATALSTRQDARGVSRIDPRTAAVVLPPGGAEHPQWIHVSLRRRDEWMAFLSSLFAVVERPAGRKSVRQIELSRGAGTPLPGLSGNARELPADAFFAMFRGAELDLDRFTGTLEIQLGPAGDPPLSAGLRFEGRIRLEGDGPVSLHVPAGETWVVRDKTFVAPCRVVSRP
jgi:hypothetical protein